MFAKLYPEFLASKPLEAPEKYELFVEEYNNLCKTTLESLHESVPSIFSNDYVTRQKSLKDVIKNILALFKEPKVKVYDPPKQVNQMIYFAPIEASIETYNRLFKLDDQLNGISDRRYQKINFKLKKQGSFTTLLGAILDAFFSKRTLNYCAQIISVCQFLQALSKFYQNQNLSPEKKLKQDIKKLLHAKVLEPLIDFFDKNLREQVLKRLGEKLEPLETKYLKDGLHELVNVYQRLSDDATRNDRLQRKVNRNSFSFLLLLGYGKMYEQYKNVWSEHEAVECMLEIKRISEDDQTRTHIFKSYSNKSDEYCNILQCSQECLANALFGRKVFYESAKLYLAAKAYEPCIKAGEIVLEQSLKVAAIDKKITKKVEQVLRMFMRMGELETGKKWILRYFAKVGQVAEMKSLLQDYSIEEQDGCPTLSDEIKNMSLNYFRGSNTISSTEIKAVLGRKVISP